MYGIYGNIYHQYTPFMLAYVPAPWILWVRSPRHFEVLGAFFGPPLAADETQLHRHMKPIPADLGDGDGKMSSINGLLPLNDGLLMDYQLLIDY